MTSHYSHSYSNSASPTVEQSFQSFSHLGGSSVVQQNYDSAALVANHQIDASILQHENPNNCTDLAPALPLDQYKLNVDQNPHVIRKKPQEKVHYLQQVAVRYLKPPPPPPAGDIIVKQLPNKQVAPAPALVVRQPGPKAPTPPPLVLREAPPSPPQPLPGKVVTVPGKILPPPARKVVVERLPQLPPKPQQVFIERWLPYGQQTQRVVYQPAKPPCLIPDPKNVVIQWEAPDVEVRKEVKNMGVFAADPREYVAKYGASLLRSDQLPEIAVQYANQPGVQLAANHRASELPLLEGDVQALRLVDLDRAGLSVLKSRLSTAGLAASSAQAYSNEQAYASQQSFSPQPAHYAASQDQAYSAEQHYTSHGDYHSAENSVLAESGLALNSPQQ